MTIEQTCVPCVIGTLDASANCCTQDSACAADTECTALVQCAQTCAGNAACNGNCEMMAPQNTHFTAFASCLQVTCPQCPAISGGATIDR